MIEEKVDQLNKCLFFSIHLMKFCSVENNHAKNNEINVVLT